jgi:hypothetical protein
MDKDFYHVVTNQAKARIANDILAQMTGDEILTENELKFMQRILSYAITEYGKIIRAEDDDTQPQRLNL